MGGEWMGGGGGCVRMCVSKISKGARWIKFIFDCTRNRPGQ